jgi:hypothetical protein
MRAPPSSTIPHRSIEDREQLPRARNQSHLLGLASRQESLIELLDGGVVAGGDQRPLKARLSRELSLPIPPSLLRFMANHFRLLLHAAAYWLMDALRRRLVGAGLKRMQLGTLRFIKIGLYLASGHPGQRLWHALVKSLRRRS